MNLTRGCDTVMHWPDTILSLYCVRITEMPAKEEVFKVFGNYPNPVMEQTNITMYIPEKNHVRLKWIFLII